MLGSALETILVLMIDAHPEVAGATNELPKRNGKVKPLLDWDLRDLLKVAKAAQWLPAHLDLAGRWDGRRAKIGDYAEVVRIVRNLVHPARYRKDHFRRRVTEKYLKQQFEVVRLCRDWLVHHNNEHLLRRLKEAGLD